MIKSDVKAILNQREKGYKKNFKNYGMQETVGFEPPNIF